jgi:hypothetical protein
MRLFPILIALLCVPALTLVHRYYYYQRMMVPLDVLIKQTLSGDEFAGVKASLMYLDVTLDGVVAELPSRERARKLVDSLPGVRCRAEDNHLTVPSQIEAKFEGKSLVLRGMLRDASALREITGWLKSARPELQIKTDAVVISPFTTPMETPRNGAISPSLRAIWSLVEVAPALIIERSGNAFTISGHLPSSQLREAVMAAVLGTKTDAVVDAKQLHAGTYVRKARFTEQDALPEFLMHYFAMGDTTAFVADEHGVHIAANVTEAIFAEWKPLLSKFCDADAALANLRFFPSIYHLPSYRPVSKLPAQNMASLQSTLRANSIRFDSTNASATPEHLAKLNALGSAIVAIPAEERIIVGTHPDASADPKAALALARRRSEEVIAQMVDRGLPAERFEIAVFTSTQKAPEGGPGLAGVVELFVK